VFRFRPWFAIAMLIAALAIFAACSSGGDNTADSNENDSKTAQATAPAGDNGDGGNGGDSGDNEDLTEIAHKFVDVSFRGEYKMTGTPDDTFGTGTLVLYKGGADRVRFDISAEQDGETTEIVLVETPDNSAFCLKNAGEFGTLLGVPDGDGVCFNNDPTGGDAAGSFSDIIDEIENGDWEILERSERKVAGEDAKCFKTRDSEGTVSDVCFSDEGYLLSAAESDGSGLEATSVSGDVSDGDFDLPYEVRELPDFGGDQ
jgi:hypothetical protein